MFKTASIFDPGLSETAESETIGVGVKPYPAAAGDGAT